MSETILVIDDHLSTRTLIADYLLESGYQVVTAADGVEGLSAARRERPALILLDVMMPELDGFAFMRTFRRESNIPVIVLTARIDEADKVVGLELGADDYLTKPFSMRELIARIRTVLRRASAPISDHSGEFYRIGDLILDRRRRVVRVAGQPASLTPSEFELLQLLIAAPGRVFPRELLLEHLQGGIYEGAERTIDVHIRNLRRKIEADPAHPYYIETVFGIGYRCRPPDSL
jgi:DNA-binding response OmpR family regulator